MPATPAGSSQPPRHPGTEGATGDPQAPPERYGRLTLTRHRKDDGRTLILYAEAEDGGGAADG